MFYKSVLTSPAVRHYCYHGGRMIHWLPYMGWDDLDGEVNVTYYGSQQPLAMHQAWRKNSPRNKVKPNCVVAYMSKEYYMGGQALHGRVLRV